jgi:hypothetical protein
MCNQPYNGNEWHNLIEMIKLDGTKIGAKVQTVTKRWDHKYFCPIQWIKYESYLIQWAPDYVNEISLINFLL